MRLDRGNVVAVARREYVARGSTRTFKWSTILLVVAGLAVALAPVLLRAVFGEGQQTRIEIFVGDASPSVDVAATVRAVLNGSATGTGSGAGTGAGSSASQPKYRVDTVTDVVAARARVLAGETEGLLVVDRPTADGDLTFAYVTKKTTLDLVAPTVRQIASSVTIQDRLARSGIAPGQQAQLLAPPIWSVQPADPNAAPGVNPNDIASGFAIGFVLAIVLFMAIILYGQWIAYSVAEEKSSRVMEVILGAATPFELLAGKVAGVGALALTQYIAVFVPAAIALLLQGQIASLLFGGAGAAPSGGIAGVADSLTSGLSIPLLLAFGVFFVLGFALYAALYAGAAALVSRTEDINQIVAPMTLVATAGYLVAVYSSTGLLDPNSTFVRIMSFIPFFSPYLMLSRVGTGIAGPLEVLVAIALLLIAIPIAIWLAARFYAAGVLMYGQRPSLRLMLRVLRGAR